MNRSVRRAVVAVGLFCLPLLFAPGCIRYAVDERGDVETIKPVATKKPLKVYLKFGAVILSTGA